MGLAERIKHLKGRELKKAQDVIATFELFGLTMEQIDLLPQVLQNWPIVAKNMNLFTQDMVETKARVSALENRRSYDADDTKDSDDTYDNIRRSAGLGTDIERFDFGLGTGK